MNHCKACGSTAMREVLDVGPVPTSSMILVENEETARDWPIGRLRLTMCEACAFIQNDHFDPNLIDYTMPYEESQASSPTFQRFAKDLIEHLNEAFDLDEATILEVGCGKGEWLAMACNQLDAKGIGIDPAYLPGRIPEEDLDRLEFIVDFFDSEYAKELTGDLVATRHTLEHIDEVLTFTRWLHTAAASTPGSGLFIEVPDTTRILREGAFWDVYYEHCSYFTSPSLAGLMARAGFGDIDVRLGYSDQYLLATGRPPGNPERAPAPIDAVIEDAERFSQNAAETVQYWRAIVESQWSAGHPTVLWGAGSKAVGFLSSIGVPVTAAVDINPFKQGHYLPGSGLAVLAPEELRRIDPELVIVMNPIYETEISDMVASIGLHPRFQSVAVVGT